MAGIKGMKSYPQKTKQEAVRLFIDEGWPQKEIMKYLGIRNETQIKSWIGAYRREGIPGLSQKHKGRPKKQQRHETIEEKIRRLEMENELLRSFLSEAERR